MTAEEIKDLVSVQHNDAEGLSSTLIIAFPVEPWEDEYGNRDDCLAAAEDWKKRLQAVYEAGRSSMQDEAAQVFKHLLSCPAMIDTPDGKESVSVGQFVAAAIRALKP